MDARSEILSTCEDHHAYRVRNELLDQFAHELAETQRDLMRSGILSIEIIIDYIDPEAP